MKILITGCNGLIGSHLVKHLKLNFDNCLIDGCDIIDLNDITKKYINNFFHISVDDYCSRYQYDIVIHCASTVGQKEVVLNHQDVIRSNVNGLMNILKQYKDSKHIFLSTSEVYGLIDSDNIFHESQLLNVNSFDKRSIYAISKILCENILQFYDNWVILRLFNIYGKYFRKDDTRAIPSFIKSIKENNKIIIHGDGSQTREFTSVNDLCKIIELIILKEINKQIFNITSQMSYTINDVSDLIMKYIPNIKKEYINFEYNRVNKRKGSNENLYRILGYNNWNRLEDEMEDILRYHIK